MPPEPVTSDDLLPLCAQVQRAARGLDQAPQLPRALTLRRLAAFATARMTHAALACERREVDERVFHEVLGAADALVFADQLLEIGVDRHGYVGGRRTAGPAALLAPDAAERAIHTAFADSTSGVAGRLRIVAEALEDAAPGAIPFSREVAASAVSRERLSELGAEALGRLREGTAEPPPADPAGREQGMVWLTFCRFCLEHALAAVEVLEGERDAVELESGLRSLPRAPELYRSLGIPVPDPHLLELAGSLIAAG